MIRELFKPDKQKKKIFLVIGLIVFLFFVVFIYFFQKDIKREIVDLPPIKTLGKIYTPENLRSMQYLDMYVMKGSTVINEVKPLLSSKEAKERWMAIYVIGRVSQKTSAEILVPFLQDEDEIVKIAAAGTLINKGYKQAIPVLIEGLGSTAFIEYLSPKREIANFCLEVLGVYTKQSFINQTDWQKWWDENRETITI